MGYRSGLGLLISSSIEDWIVTILDLNYEYLLYTIGCYRNTLHTTLGITGKRESCRID
jgi:hypothetical protein